MKADIYVAPMWLHAPFCDCGQQMRLHSTTKTAGYDELIWHCPKCSQEVPANVAVRYNPLLVETPCAVLPHPKVLS